MESEVMTSPTWRKVAYGGMQPGFDDNHTDDSFLEEMVMNANVVKRDILKVMLDSVCISQYLCIVALVGLVWTYTLRSILNENSLLLLDVTLLGLGFLVLLLTKEMLSFNLFLRYLLNISFFISGLYVLAPIYQTLTTSISSNSIWAVTVALLVLHLFLHDYFGSTVRAPGALHNPTLTSCISLNASVVASVFIASCLRSRLQENDEYHLSTNMCEDTFCAEVVHRKLDLIFTWLLFNPSSDETICDAYTIYGNFLCRVPNSHWNLPSLHFHEGFSKFVISPSRSQLQREEILLIAASEVQYNRR
ncbi:hypothetical protein ACLB2K_011293 [Fragaria x ananassa]